VEHPIIGITILLVIAIWMATAAITRKLEGIARLIERTNDLLHEQRDQAERRP